MGEYDDSFRLTPFREFYAEIINLKQEVGARVWVSPADAANYPSQPGDAPDQTDAAVYYPNPDGDAGPDNITRLTTHALTATVNNSTALVKVEPGGNNSAIDLSELQPLDSLKATTLVWHRLVTLFQRQAIAAWKNGGSYGAQSYKESQYVMVALADEIFLHMQWEGQLAWDSHLLEAKIFRTHAAGQVFFENLDHMLQERNPLTRDLATVYLMALALGFRGKYYGMDDRGRLAHYRRQLFIFICGREPKPDDETRPVFPEAYFHNVREESRRKLSDPRKWIVVLCLVIIVYTVATQTLWIQFTRDLNTVNQSIAKIIGQLKAQP